MRSVTSRVASPSARYARAEQRVDARPRHPGQRGGRDDDKLAMFGADVARSASALARATLAGVSGGLSAERAPGEDSLEHHVERRSRLLGLGGRGRGREVARSMVCSLLSTCTCYMAIEG